MPKDRIGWLRGLRVAHRGLYGADGSGGARIENAPAAFAAAVAAGLGIECDVQESADGQAMVFHDFTLDRLTDATGPLIARSADALAAICLRGSGEPIPRLADFLALVGGRVPLLIEVKTDTSRRADQLARAVAAELADYAGPVAVMSLDCRVPQWFAGHAPTIARGLVLDRADMHGAAAARTRQYAMPGARPDFLAVDARGLPSPWITALRAEGLPIATWTIRSARQRAHAAPHVDALITEAGGFR